MIVPFKYATATGTERVRDANAATVPAPIIPIYSKKDTI